MPDYSNLVFEQAVELARRVGATGIISCVDYADRLPDPIGLTDGLKLVLIARGEGGRERAEELSQYVMDAPKARLTRNAQIDLAVLSATAQGLFGPDETMICLAGPPIEAAGADMIHLVSVAAGHGSACFNCHDGLQNDVPPQVFNTVLNLAVELAQEGREGRPIGTIFVLGDTERVLQFSRQAVLNPFMGHTEEELSIMSGRLKDTIREFAGLDGAFVIKKNGTLVAAGRHLSAGSADLELPQGMGARHHAAAAITEVTSAVALAISESSGAVSVFHRGRLMASLVKEVASVTTISG